MSIEENTPLFWGIGMLVVGALITLGTHIGAGRGENKIVTMALRAVEGSNPVIGV